MTGSNRGQCATSRRTLAGRLSTVVLTGALGLASGPCPPGRDDGSTPVRPQVPRKVAVLVACEPAETGDLQLNSEFWYDTVLTYCMLRRSGFADGDIYVLYGNGEDGFYTRSGGSDIVSAASPGMPPYYLRDGGYCGDRANTTRISDFPMTTRAGSMGCARGADGTWECRPWSMFDCLARGCDDPGRVFGRTGWNGPPIEKLTGDDYLFVWWKGHGTKRADGPLELSIGLDRVTDADVSGWIAAVPAGHRLLVFETCHAGCLVGSLQGEQNTILLTSCGCEDQNSYPLGTPAYDTWHGVFSFWIAGTLGGVLPPGAQNPINPNTPDQRLVDVSAGETVEHAFDESRAATEMQVGSAGKPAQQPQKRDDAALAPQTRLGTVPPVQTPAPNPTPTPATTPGTNPRGPG